MYWLAYYTTEVTQKGLILASTRGSRKIATIPRITEISLLDYLLSYRLKNTRKQGTQCTKHKAQGAKRTRYKTYEVQSTESMVRGTKGASYKAQGAEHNV